eukprot:GAHX01001434.1.p1 GENE.GAHX01001434.1~~GAHX01001434.1.p1  ORF type:complete len:289 (-),score=59.20 GAHX01001434.1:49-915(-)
MPTTNTPVMKNPTTKKPKIDYQTKINKNRRLSCLLKKTIALSKDTGCEISFVVLQDDKLIEYTNQRSPLGLLNSVTDGNREVYTIGEKVESQNIDTSKLTKIEGAIEDNSAGPAQEDFEDLYVFGETSQAKPRVGKKTPSLNGLPSADTVKTSKRMKEMELIKQYNRPDYDFISDGSQELFNNNMPNTPYLYNTPMELDESKFQYFSPGLNSIYNKNTPGDDEYMNGFFVDIKWDNLLQNLHLYEEDEIFQNIQNPNLLNSPEIKEEESRLSKHIDNMSKFLNQIQNK